MSRLGDILGVAREGAADLLGLGDELVDLREAAADGKMLARKIEDLGWGDLGGGSEDQQEMRRMQHREVVGRAYRYYFGDPIVRRAVDLRTFYVFASGVATPRYSDDPNSDEDDQEAERGNDVLERFWKDPENRAVLTAASGQYQKELELQAQGNVFLLGFPAERDDGQNATLKLSDIPEREVVDIITHPENRKKNIWYRRQFVTRRWDPTSGVYQPGNPVDRYYRDWSNDPPKDGELFDGHEWKNPVEGQIGEGFVYHIAVNKTSDMRFGQSELQSILDMAQSLSAYMTNRSAVVRVISKLAMSVKVDGGARSVAQVKNSLADAQALAGALSNGSGDPGLARHRASEEQATAAITGRGTDLQPMVPDTGAQGASTDISTMKGHMAAGSGIPLAHLGTEAGALAGSITQDRPLMALLKARQELWRTAMRDMAGWSVEIAGLDKNRVQLTMPALTDRDADATATTLTALLTVVMQLLATRDKENRALARWAMAEVLDEMGKENAQQLVDGMIEPEVPELTQEQLYNLAQQTGVEVEDVKASLAVSRDASAQAASEQRAGGLRGPDERAADGSDGQASIDRGEQNVNQLQREGDVSALVESAVEGFDRLLDANAVRDAGGVRA